MIAGESFDWLLIAICACSERLVVDFAFCCDLALRTLKSITYMVKIRYETKLVSD